MKNEKLLQALSAVLHGPMAKAIREKIDRKNPQGEDEAAWAELCRVYESLVSPVGFLAMTHEERETAMDENPPVCTHVHDVEAYFDWSWTGCGFGQMRFHVDSDGHWAADTEGMGPESTRALLHAFADHVADKVIAAEKENAEHDAKMDALFTDGWPQPVADIWNGLSSLTLKLSEPDNEDGSWIIDAERLGSNHNLLIEYSPKHGLQVDRLDDNGDDLEAIPMKTTEEVIAYVLSYIENHS